MIDSFKPTKVSWFFFCFIGLATRLLTADVVINEILFHPGPDLPENLAEEFVELINRSNSTVNVGGWTVSGGIDFTFPDALSISPGGFLVIAKDVAHLRQTYSQLSESNAIGNYSGRLSNRGETLKLEKPTGFLIDGTAPMIEVDSVRYRDSGRGYRWADGGGSSLELRDFEADVDEFAAAIQQRLQGIRKKRAA